LLVKGRLLLAVASILVAIGVMGWIEGVSADQPTSDYYIALGDSVAAGSRASLPHSLGYVGLFNQFYQDHHPGKEGFANLSVSGENSATFLGNQMAGALATINDPNTDVQVVTLTLGVNDFLPLITTEPCTSDPGGVACQLAVATTLTTFAGRYLIILATLDLALAGEPGEGRILVTTYYNPFDGTGDLREDLVDTALLGSDGDIDCDAVPEDLKNMGLNDVITCVGELVGAEIVDIYPLFNNAAPELTHIAEEDIHPNNKGHQAIADEVIDIYNGG
jgi:lysophospholipase L1-like esterase